MIIQSCDVIKLFAREFERILVGGGMFINQSLAVWRIPYELAHVAGRVGEVAGAADVVGMEVEEVVLTLVVGLEAYTGLRLLWRLPQEIDWRTEHLPLLPACQYQVS